jgi:hypothetical protein
MRPMEMSSEIGYVHSAQFSIISGSSGNMNKPAVREIRGLEWQK